MLDKEDVGKFIQAGLSVYISEGVKQNKTTTTTKTNQTKKTNNNGLLEFIVA